MDELLYLEPDEEITSVIDKLKALPGDSVALILPKNASLAASVVNLKLIKREALRLKKTVAIVTQDKVGTSLAGQVGIPVYAAVGDNEPVATPKKPKPTQDDVIELDDRAEDRARPTEDEDEGAIPVHRYDTSTQSEHNQVASQLTSTSTTKSRSNQTRPQSRGKNIRLRRGPVLGLIAVLFLAALAWLLIVYPRATITLAVTTEPIHQTVGVTVDNNIPSNNVDKATVAGQKLQVETTVKQTFDATGSKEVGTKSTGTVTIQNRLGDQVSVPKGSTLARDSVTFVTTDDTTVSAASVSLDATGNVLVKPGTKDVHVEAAAVGSSANLAPGDFVITSFNGAKRDRVTASNAAAFTGGESHTVKVVTNNDIENAKKSISDKSHGDLLNQLQSKAHDLTILQNTVEVQTVDASTNKQVDEQTDSFDLTAKVRARAVAFAANDYQQMVVALVGKALPEGKELVVTNQDSVETSVESTDYDHGLLKLKSTFSTEMAQKIDQAALRNLVRGKSVSEAQALLSKQSGIQSARITLRPSFKSHLPTSDSQLPIELARQ